MRLNRYLAAAGLGSRRSCEELILERRVSINGTVIDNLATIVGPEDEVRVGRRIIRVQPKTHILLNKPAGYLCTRSDEKNRKTIFDLAPNDRGRLFHVGRLDKESEGLIILTNDGDFAQQLTHPSHAIEKEYEVFLDKDFDPTKTARLLKGFPIEGGKARMESVFQLGPRKLRVVLRQGLKRQIREMLWIVGYRVTRLVRTRIGPLRDPRLKNGYWRLLKKSEIDALRAG